MQIRLSNAPDAPAPVGQYTHAVEVTGATRTVYISGQVGGALDGSVPEDAMAQGRNVWNNITAQLRAVGMTLDNIVKIITIVTSLDHLPAVRATRAEAMGDRKPASTLIVAGLVSPALKIEVEVIAVA
jgi:enamine deaminase RidA (YjgF/YER057c/UK114 family)